MADIERDNDPSPLFIQLFGPFEVLVNGVPLSRLRSRKGPPTLRAGTRLLVLLALRSGSSLDRSLLAGTLWPDSDGPQALGLPGATPDVIESEL